MLRLLNKCFCISLLAISVQQAGAFALLGPDTVRVPDDYQQPIIGYQLAGDIGTPKNLGEEYRWNTPDIFYTYDASFLQYFGSNGVYAIEQAIAIFNNVTAFTNLSSLSPELSEYPLEALRANYQAQALSLTDLKSFTMYFLIEQLGLAEPDRYVWTLRNREVGPGGCPADVLYNVIQRNFDPVISPLDQLQPSSYVNGVLYTYSILEFCTGPNPLAEAVELAVDPLARTFRPVAALGFLPGEFYTGLTRDDVGGLRYLYRTNNMNIESAAPGSLAFATNTSTFQLLFTSNLTLLVNQSLTNTAAQLQVLFPNIVISSTTPIFTNVVSTNIFFVLTNLPWAPAGTFYVATFSNITVNVQTNFYHTFANVITNTYYTNGFVTIVDNGFTALPNAPAGTFYPSTTARTVLTNFINGDYYILPPNSDCAVSIVATQLVYVVTSTNAPNVATNAAGQTNINGQAFSESLVFYQTNRVFLINPVPCATNAPALRQGIDKFRFIRRDFDSLLGQVYIPHTNFYVHNIITNSTLRPTMIRRTVIQPDLLISAEDATVGPPGTGAPVVPNYGFRSINFNSNSALTDLAGPGTLDPGVNLTFSKVGPQYINLTVNFLDDLTKFPILIWGSFDATTNAPVIYPNGTSVANLESQVLILMAPLALPQGTLGAPYSSTFSITAGGQAPFVWSLTPGTPGLPSGLALSPDGVLSGTPETIGTFDISIRVTDAGARTVDRTYAIKVVEFEP